jgi:hypothetical protein
MQRASIIFPDSLRRFQIVGGADGLTSLCGRRYDEIQIA